MVLSSKEFIEKKNADFIKNKNKPISVKDITRKGKNDWIREAWTFMQQSNYAQKVFVIERLRRANFLKEVYKRNKQIRIGDIEYRIGYYIVGKIGNKKDKWTWGQYCPFIPKEDFSKLVNKAKKEGTIE